MRSAPTPTHHRPMAQTPRSTTLRLDLQVGTDPIRGYIEHPDGRRHPFWGWLELIELVNQLGAPPDSETDLQHNT
jgi:hypothetical protein